MQVDVVVLSEWYNPKFVKFHSCFRGQEPMIMVSPAGVLHAVNPVTRQTLWTYASGSEMGSVLRTMNGKDSREINSSLDVSTDDDIDGEVDEQVVFSGPDGKLYILDGSQVGVSIRISCIFIRNVN